MSIARGKVCAYLIEIKIIKLRMYSIRHHIQHDFNLGSNSIKHQINTLYIHARQKTSTHIPPPPYPTDYSVLFCNPRLIQYHPKRRYSTLLLPLQKTYANSEIIQKPRNGNDRRRWWNEEFLDMSGWSCVAGRCFSFVGCGSMYVGRYTTTGGGDLSIEVVHKRLISSIGCTIATHIPVLWSSTHMWKVLTRPRRSNSYVLTVTP